MSNNDLKLYEIEEEKLYKEMNNLSFEEVSDRLNKLWKLIPIQYSINPIRLMNKFKRLFGNHPKRKEQIKTYEIDIQYGEK